MATTTLQNVRAASDITVKARLKDSGVALDWTGMTSVKACIYSDAQKAVAGSCTCSVDESDSTLLLCDYSAEKPQYLGVNRLIIQVKYEGKTKTYDAPAFNIVEWTDEVTDDEIELEETL